MKTFYRDTNNGLTALVSEGTYELILARSGGSEEAPFPGPIFLFSDQDEAPWVCGTLALMRRLTADAIVLAGSIPVPFSNGWQLYPDTGTVVDVFGSVGNLQQAIVAFDLMPTDRPIGIGLLA